MFNEIKELDHEIIAKRIFDLLKEDIKNKEPNKNRIILTPKLIEESYIHELEITEGKNTGEIIRVGKMYKELEGLLTFYKTPTFLGSLIE